jgi:hypothetical protein
MIGMDKPSERKAEVKKWGDTDVDTTRDFDAGGKRQQLDGLWADPTTITGGSKMQRLAQNNYCKEDHAKAEKADGLVDALLDSADTHGPPLLNVSKPRRIF